MHRRELGKRNKNDVLSCLERRSRRITIAPRWKRIDRAATATKTRGSRQQPRPTSREIAPECRELQCTAECPENDGNAQHRRIQPTPQSGCEGLFDVVTAVVSGCTHHRVPELGRRQLWCAAWPARRWKSCPGRHGRPQLSAHSPYRRISTCCHYRSSSIMSARTELIVCGTS